jgi:hypothetical protein
MPEMGTSGLMSGDGKRGGAIAPVLAPILDSTDAPCPARAEASSETRRGTQSACATMGFRPACLGEAVTDHARRWSVLLRPRQLQHVRLPRRQTR